MNLSETVFCVVHRWLCLSFDMLASPQACSVGSRQKRLCSFIGTTCFKTAGTPVSMRSTGLVSPHIAVGDSDNRFIKQVGLTMQVNFLPETF